MDIKEAKKLVKEYHPKMDFDVLSDKEIISIAKRIKKFMDSLKKDKKK